MGERTSGRTSGDVAGVHHHVHHHHHDQDDPRLVRLQQSVDSLATDVRRIIRMEAYQMSFAQDVLDRIARQTTVIGSIKEWIKALPVDQVPEAAKAAILANLDQNEADLNTAIPVNTPVDPNA